LRMRKIVIGILVKPIGPNIDLHNIVNCLNFLADLQIYDMSLSEKMKDLFINRIHLANSAKITSFIMAHNKIAFSLWQGILSKEEEVLIYRGPGKFMSNFNEDFWVQVTDTLKIRIKEFSVKEMRQIFVAACRPALKLKRVNR
jgi:hypothetical protein